MATSTIQQVLPCWIVLFALLCACDSRGTDPFARASKRIEAKPPKKGPLDDPSLGIRCNNKVAGYASLYQTAALVPEELEKKGGPNEKTWTPGIVVDIAATPRGYAVLDRASAEVTILSSDLTPVRVWGRRGPRSDEYQDPIAITVDDATGDIWVLDAAPPKPRLLRFDSLGANRSVTTLDGTVVADLARSGSDVFVSRTAFAEGMRKIPADMGIVQAVDDEATFVRTILSLEPNDMTFPRYVLPGPNQVRLSANGKHVAVFYPAAGAIDIYENGAVKSTIQVCVGKALLRAYREQMKTRDQSQKAYPIISDVYVDSSGVVAISRMYDKKGNLQIDHFDLHGRDLGSWLIPSRGVSLPSELRFGKSASEVIAIGRMGTIIQMELRKVPSAR